MKNKKKYFLGFFNIIKWNKGLKLLKEYLKSLSIK